MNNTLEKIKTLQVIIDKEACSSQKIKICNARCVQTKHCLKITGRLSSNRNIWDSLYVAITVEAANREIIDSRVSRAVFNNNHGFFDVKFYNSDIKDLTKETEEVCSIGIMPLKTHDFNEEV